MPWTRSYYPNGSSNAIRCGPRRTVCCVRATVCACPVAFPGTRDNSCHTNGSQIRRLSARACRLLRKVPREPLLDDVDHHARSRTRSLTPGIGSSSSLRRRAASHHHPGGARATWMANRQCGVGEALAVRALERRKEPLRIVPRACVESEHLLVKSRRGGTGARRYTSGAACASRTTRSSQCGSSSRGLRTYFTAWSIIKCSNPHDASA